MRSGVQFTRFGSATIRGVGNDTVHGNGNDTVHGTGNDMDREAKRAKQ